MSVNRALHVVSRVQDLLDVQAAKVAMQREREATGLRFATIVCPCCGAEIDGIGETDGKAQVEMSKAIEQHFRTVHPGAAVNKRRAAGELSGPTEHALKGAPIQL